MDIKLTTNSIIHCTERQQYNAVTHILHKCGYVWNSTIYKSLKKKDFWIRARENTALVVDIFSATVDCRNINSKWFNNHKMPIMDATDFIELHDMKIPNKSIDVYYHGDPNRDNEVIAALMKLGGINFWGYHGTSKDAMYYISKNDNYIKYCDAKEDKELTSFIIRFYKMLTLPPIETIEIEGKKYRKEEVFEKLKDLKTY